MRATATVAPTLAADWAPDFAPWSRTVEVLNQDYSCGGFASLESSLDPDGLHAVAVAKGYDGVHSTHGDGRVEVDATFTVQDPTPYLLAGRWNVSWDYNTDPEAHVRFGPVAAPASLLNSSSVVSYVDPLLLFDTYSQRGLLQPGQYRIKGLVFQTSHSYPNTFQRTGGFTIDLDLFCAADYDGSGSASVQDIFEFLGGCFTRDPRADYDGSGSITVQDIFEFLAVYFTGCPLHRNASVIEVTQPNRSGMHQRYWSMRSRL